MVEHFVEAVEVIVEHDEVERALELELGDYPHKRRNCVRNLLGVQKKFGEWIIEKEKFFSRETLGFLLFLSRPLFVCIPMILYKFAAHLGLNYTELDG